MRHTKLMRLTVTTWNINSVRLRIDLVAKFIKAVRPDVLCLQETKCPDDAFPLKRFRRLGYEHVALNGQKGYHGVVVVSRLPFETTSPAGLLRQDRLPACVGDARRARRACAIRSRCTISMCRPAATSPTPRSIRNSSTSSRSSTRCATAPTLRCNGADRAILVGDLNVAPLEHDVWSHKQMLGWSRTRRSNARSSPPRRSPATGSTSMRMHVPEPAKLYTWWSYRAPRLGGRRPRPPARSHLDVAGARRPASPTSRSPRAIAAARGRPTTCR